MIGIMLSIVIPAVVIGYGVWLAVRMVRNRNRKGCGYGGCGSCPYAGSCQSTENFERPKREEPHA